MKEWYNVLCVRYFKQGQSIRQDKTLVVYHVFNVVDRDFMITDVVVVVNLTSHNIINSAEIIGYNPFIRNDNSLNLFILTNYDQLSFNCRFFFHKFYNGAYKRCFFCGSFLLVMLHVGVCCVVLSCLFFVALWSPAGKALTSWPSCLLCFVTFPNMSWSTSESRVRLAP